MEKWYIIACRGRVTTHRDGSCMMQPPTYLMTNEGAGRWAGEEEALARVSPDTRVMWDVTMENLENIIMTINLSGESHKANQVYLLSLKATCKDLKRRKKSDLCFQKYHQGENATGNTNKISQGKRKKEIVLTIFLFPKPRTFSRAHPPAHTALGPGLGGHKSPPSLNPWSEEEILFLTQNKKRIL